MNRNLWKSLFAATALVVLGAGAAQAQAALQTSTNMEVRVRIVDGCTVNLLGGTQVQFSDRAQIIDDSLTREVNVNCTLGTASGSPGVGVNDYELRLSSTFTPSTSGAVYAIDDRFMSNQSVPAGTAGNHPIYYSVRTTDTCSASLWGDGTGNTEVITGNFPTPPGGNRHAFNVCIDRAYNAAKGVFPDQPTLGLYADTTQIQLWY